MIHPTCAIVHAADDRSVTETVECLPYVIHSARALFAGKPYCLGPVAIGTRGSPFGGRPAPNPQGGRVAMCRNDPRQRGLLGAAWHLGVAARAAEGAVTSLILGAPTGDHGLVHHPGDTPQPWFDEHGGRFPAWHVMRGDVRRFGPGAARDRGLGAARSAGHCVRDRERGARALAREPHGRGAPHPAERHRRGGAHGWRSWTRSASSRVLATPICSMEWSAPRAATGSSFGPMRSRAAESDERRPRATCGDGREGVR